MVSRNLSELVTAIFQAWHEAGVAFLVLRNYERLPQDVGNDVDVLIRPAQLALAENVMVTAALSTGYRLHNRAEFSPVSYFFHHPESLRQLQIDLFYNHQWRGFDLLPVEVVMDRRRRRSDLFSVPSAVHEAISDLLGRLIFHGYVKENYKELIQATARSEGLRMTQTLTEMFGEALAGQLVEAMAQGRWEVVEGCFGAMRRELIWRRLTGEPLHTLRSILRDYRRFLKRLWHPPGLVVVLIGPDGCGKSTVAQRVAERLVHTFRPDKSVRIHWKPAVFFKGRRAARPPTVDPHGQSCRGPVLSLVFLVYHWIEYLVGGWLHFLPVRFRNGLVLVDRYYYDFAVDPRRFRMQVQPAVVRWLFRHVPQPDLVFLLDAPADILRARKAEVTAAETERQRKAYQELLSRLSHGRTVDATAPTEVVTDQILSEILAFMTERQSLWRHD